MTEAEFNALVDVALARIESALEASGADLDYAWVGDGIIEIEFTDNSKIVVNRHLAAQELWVAARSGGYHFRWDGAVWRDTRDGTELISSLAQLASAQAGESVNLA